MRVARRDPDQYGLNPIVDEPGGIRAIVRVDTVLEGNAVRLRHIREPPQKATVVVDAGILVDQGRARAEPRRVFLLFHRRHIADEADIEGNGEIERLMTADGPRAVQPILL